MKLILGVIQPLKLDAVQEALDHVDVTRMTVCDALGYARQRGQTTKFRDAENNTTLLRKVELEILVNDDFVDRTIHAIESVARTGPHGSIGDGKLFVLDVERVIRISDGKEGPEAV